MVELSGFGLTVPLRVSQLRGLEFTQGFHSESLVPAGPLRSRA